MSYSHAPDGSWPLVLGSGHWIWDREIDGECEGGDPSHQKGAAQLSLPQPPQDPIATLTGRGHQEVTGNCAQNVEIDVKFVRTGDLAPVLVPDRRHGERSPIH